jgi:tetratricopeptide (TPR) repeat protein
MTGSLVNRELRNWIFTLVVILTLAGAIMKVLTVLETQRPPAMRAEGLSYLPKGQYLKVAVLGYRQIVADFIWLKVLYYFGMRNQTNEGFRWTYHAVDVLTDLDPKFTFAYQAAGTVLAVWAKQVHESIALLVKGMHYNPEAWILPFIIGYDYYFELHDRATASRYFQIAAMLPGSPRYLPELATKMTVEAGDPEAALEFLQRLYQQTQDEHVQKGLMQQMKEVLIERDIRFLENAIRRYQSRYGKPPKKLNELVTGGIILQIPDESLKGLYQLKADGTIASMGLHKRLQMFNR